MVIGLFNAAAAHRAQPREPVWFKRRNDSNRRAAGERQPARRGNRRRKERNDRKDHGGRFRNGNDDRRRSQRRSMGQLADAAMRCIVRHMGGTMSRVRILRTRSTRSCAMPFGEPMDGRRKNQRPDEKGQRQNVQSFGHACLNFITTRPPKANSCMHFGATRVVSSPAKTDRSVSLVQRRPSCPHAVLAINPTAAWSSGGGHMPLV